jgi:hypothetical protein
MDGMQKTPNEVLQGQPPTLPESTVEAVKAMPRDHEVEVLRMQRTRFDGYFTGPTW